MGMKVTLTLVAGLLLGTSPGIPAEPAPKALKDAENTTIVLPENATITIAPGTKFNLRPVKTKQGKRIRLEMPGVTIEAVQLRVKSKGKIFEMKIDAGDAFTLRRFDEGEIGAPTEPAAAADRPRK